MSIQDGPERAPQPGMAGGLTAHAVGAVQAESQRPVGEWVASATDTVQQDTVPFNTGLPAAVPAPFNVPVPVAAPVEAPLINPQTTAPIAPLINPQTTVPIAPLINPLQTTAPPPSSTVVEPSRSPQGQSVKRSSPDERQDDDRDIKRVRPDESTPTTPMAPPAVPTPEPVAVAAPAPAAAAPPAPTPAPAPAAYPPAPYQQTPPQVVPPVAPSPIVTAHTYVPPPAKPAGPTTPLTVTQHKHLIGVVRTLKRSKDALAFLAPVDPILFGIPHYTQIVTRPMDLGTVETKLIVSNPNGQPKDKSKMKNWDYSKGTYRSVSEVVADVRQIWENTRMFNGPEHGVSQAATRLEEIFEKSLDKIPAEPAYAAYASSPAAPSPDHYASTSQAVRRPSVSHPPTIRRNSQGPDASRPKREIHPPPPKDLLYNDGPQGKKKSRKATDAQLSYAARAVNDLMTKKQYWEVAIPFLAPVDAVALGIPEYSRIIKRPMDMGTIKTKLAEGEYNDASEVNDDMKLMFSNCFTFNPPNTPVHTAGKQLQQAWAEKWRALPPKVEPRGDSDFDDDASDDDSDGMNESIRLLESQAAEIQRSLTRLREKRAARKAARQAGRSHPYKQAKAARPAQPKARPSNGHSPANGSSRKAKASSGIVYREDDGGDYESEDESQSVTLTQKQALAERIQEADPDTLAKAIKIIQETTSLGSNDDEIELDIDALPPGTVLKLYNLVVRGPRKATSSRPKSQAALVQGKKPGRKGTGGLARKSMNEQEEAERIRKMEDQLKSFDNPQHAQQHDLESDESSDDDSDDED